MYAVDLSRVEKQLRKIPNEIVARLQRWARTVEEFGLPEARKVKGYHDEPLHGQRRGQRSIRLGIKWRAIYGESESDELIMVIVEEITPHDYRTK
ncbi:MAG: hypothetical protein C5B49_11460 [Bdellovibrio sp.]|nr:MAG: hypothetical protein C5B49_11460 [Bdellovibrio sp.]